MSPDTPPVAPGASPAAPADGAPTATAGSSAPAGPAAGRGITYADAGVDTAAGDRAVELMKDAVAATMTPAVVG